MKKIFVAVCTVFLASAVLLSAQNYSETDPTVKSALESRNGVGAAYFSPNNFTGDAFLGGLCYQHWYTDRIGSEFGGSVFWSPDSDSDPLTYNIYAECDFVLFQSEPSKYLASRLFAWALLAHTGDIASDYDYNTETYVKKAFVPDFRAGIGFGFDVILFRHISLPIKFGFTGSMHGAGFTFGGGIKYVW